MRKHINAYIIDSSKISMSHFAEVAVDLFRVIIGKELCYIRIAKASRPACNWTGH